MYLDLKFLQISPCRPAAGRPVPAARQLGGRVYFCKFRKWKYIFVKNENKNINKKKTARPFSLPLPPFRFDQVLRWLVLRQQPAGSFPADRTYIEIV